MPTTPAGAVVVTRIFQHLSAGILIPPGDPVLVIVTEGNMTTEVNNCTPQNPPDDESFTPAKHIPFPPIPDPSIASFLRAHPTPLSPTQLSPLNITPSDFAAALGQIQPSSTREGFATVSNVTWSDN